MTTAYLVTDIDGTLGSTVDDIAASLSELRQLAPAMTICLVTGRTLTSLAVLAPFIPAGTLVSPWGGGNLLRRLRSGYEPVAPLTAVRRPLTLADFHLTFVPRTAVIDESMEVTLAPQDRSGPLSHVCVGGFKAATCACPSAPRGVRHRGLQGAQWDIVSPWRRPRERLLRTLKESGSPWIAYWGDDHVDEQAVGLAAVVLAPEGTALAACVGVQSYRSVQHAVCLTMLQRYRGRRRRLERRGRRGSSC